MDLKFRRNPMLPIVKHVQKNRRTKFQTSILVRKPVDKFVDSGNLIIAKIVRAHAKRAGSATKGLLGRLTTGILNPGEQVV